MGEKEFSEAAEKFQKKRGNSSSWLSNYLFIEILSFIVNSFGIYTLFLFTERTLFNIIWDIITLKSSSDSNLPTLEYYFPSITICHLSYPGPSGTKQVLSKCLKWKYMETLFQELDAVCSLPLNPVIGKMILLLAGKMFAVGIAFTATFIYRLLSLLEIVRSFGVSRERKDLNSSLKVLFYISRLIITTNLFLPVL